MDDKIKDPMEISKLFSDQYTAKILAGSCEEAKAVQELAIEFDIPIAGCYRRVRELEKLGIIECAGVELSSKGKEVRMYRSKVKSAYISYDKGRLAVTLKWVDEEDETLKNEIEIKAVRE